MKKIILSIVFAFLFLGLKAQDTSRYSIELNHKTFRDLSQALENSTSYVFYYDKAELDTISIQVNAHGLSIQEILDQALKNSGFIYSIDDQNRIFITKGLGIYTRLPLDYFEESKLENKAPLPIPDFEEAPKIKEIKTSLENKIFIIGIPTAQDSKKTSRIIGYIKDQNSGEGVLGALVSWDNHNTGVITDQFGYYSLNLAKGPHTLNIQSTGMKSTKRQILLHSDGRLDIQLQEYVSTLKTVTVTGEKGQNIRSAEIGLNKLNVRQIKQVPVVFGEADIVKVVLTLPGVSSVGEASNGFNVRGGATDQNLILFNDATLYNPSHLFGFFSAFNPDLVKGIELYKSSIPEKYGGRLSSVLDISLQDGNQKKWTGNIAVGPVTGKLSLQGPIQKDKTSLILGFRTTYSDWLLKAIQNSSLRVSDANFNDGSIKITHLLNEKNSIYAMAYFSNDQFSINKDSLYNYGNRNFNLKWKHEFNNKFGDLITLGIDHYQYNVKSHSNPLTAFDLGFKINQDYLRADFNYSLSEKHIFNFGLNSILYHLNPGSYTPNSSSSLVISKILEAEQGLETALYFGDQYTLHKDILLNLGIRYSVFNYLGPHSINQYIPGLPRDTSTLTGIQSFGSGKIIQTYSAPEIRLGIRYTLNENSSLKLSFNNLQQYIHLLSNTIAISPTDIWKLSDPNIKPQSGNQWSLGYYHNYASNTIEASLEIYYKKIYHYLDYKSGASLLLNTHIETEVINTQGKAYGIEFLLKKTSGKLNGWISYAYSRTFLKVDDPLAGQTINQGNYYPASFDKPHNFNFIGNYRFTHRYSMSLNVIYSTGRPITLPLATFILGGANSLLYSNRNQYRVPDYFRTDLSFTFDGNHKIHQKFHSFWSFGVYNLTGRENAYSNYFTEVNGKIQGFQLSIFGSAIPFLTYNIQF